MFFKSIVAAALVLTSVNAHMHMTKPASLGSKENSFSPAGSIDFDYDSPLAPSGANFPCKNMLSLLTGPGGKPVASWPAGSQQTISIGGGAAHAGGSCQISISLDKGATFKVLKSFIGNCPLSGGGTFSFTVPAETKPGDVVLSWTWFNKVGNREMYQNCAVVSITGGGTSNLSSYPDMFTANIGKGCSTSEGVDLAFPNPGKFVENVSQKTGPPIGSCQAAGSSGSTSAAPTTPTAPIAPTEPKPSTGDNTSLPVSTPTQTFDDGMYRPSKTQVPVKPEAPVPSPGNPVETPEAPVPSPSNPVETPEAPVPSPSNPTDNSQGDAYDIVIDIDGKKMTGKATLSKHTPTTQYRHRAMRFRRR